MKHPETGQFLYLNFYILNNIIKLPLQPPGGNNYPCKTYVLVILSKRSDVFKINVSSLDVVNNNL